MMEELINKSLEMCIQCMTYAEEHNLTDTLMYINWEDKINEISCKDHTKCRL